MQHYRILSLDGGGAWALVQAMALREIYGGDMPGHDLLRQFDLIAANSGGSLVLAALADNRSPAQIEQLFLDRDQRRSIFSRTRNALLPLSQRLLGLGPKYSTRQKLIALQKTLPGSRQPMDQVIAHLRNHEDRPVHLLVLGFDYDRRRAVFFRSNLQSRSGSFGHGPAPSLAEAVHASTNAPINYFDAPAAFEHPHYRDRRFWDGALAGYNNPVLAAVVETIANWPANASSPASQAVSVLSIGTGNVSLPQADRTVRPPLAEPRSSANLMADVRKVSTSILDDPPDVATFVAHLMLGQPLPEDPARPVSDGSVIRLNPLVQPIWDEPSASWRLPLGLDQKAFGRVAGLDMDAVEQDDVRVIQNFANLWIASTPGGVVNQPIRAGRRFVCEIGHATFRAGADAWNNRVGR
jgi:uncharacterized protein